MKAYWHSTVSNSPNPRPYVKADLSGTQRVPEFKQREQRPALRNTEGTGRVLVFVARSKSASTRFSEALGRIRQLSDDWDTYGAPAPSQLAQTLAESAIDVSFEIGLTPTAVVPSVEGGVALCFRSGDRYAHIEFFNDEEVLGLTAAPDQETHTWPIANDERAVQDALLELDAFLKG